MSKIKEFGGASDYKFPEYSSEKARIKAYSEMFKNADIPDAFAKIYREDNIDTKALKTKDGRPLYIEPQVAKPNKIYFGEVVKFGKSGAEIVNPQFNERFVTKEDFTKYPLFENYLLNNRNQVFFKVKKINEATNIVSVNVLEAYFDKWSEDLLRFAEYKQPVKVYDLTLTPGGFNGKIDIPYLSQMLGVKYFLNAFIPGSQITLNVEREFSRWIGAEVDVLANKFVTNNNQLSIMCSRKAYLKNIGYMNIARLYALKDVKSASKPKYKGIVTGIINTNKKCGIFVECPDECFTGLVPCTPAELVEYRPGMEVSVRISDFESREGKKPIIYKWVENPNRKKGQPRMIETDIIEYVNVRPVLEFA